MTARPLSRLRRLCLALPRRTRSRPVESRRSASATAVPAALRPEGCPVDDRIESSDFGRFSWVSDPEGNRVELWEPPRAAGRSSE